MDRFLQAVGQGGRMVGDLYRRWGRGGHMSWKSERDLRHRSILPCTCDKVGKSGSKRAVSQQGDGWEIWKEKARHGEKKARDGNRVQTNDKMWQASKAGNKNNSQHSWAPNTSWTLYYCRERKQTGREWREPQNKVLGSQETPPCDLKLYLPH